MLSMCLSFPSLCRCKKAAACVFTYMLLRTCTKKAVYLLTQKAHWITVFIFHVDVGGWPWRCNGQTRQHTKNNWPQSSGQFDSTSRALILIDILESGSHIILESNIFQLLKSPNKRSNILPHGATLNVWWTVRHSKASSCYGSLAQCFPCQSQANPPQ